MKPVLKAAPSVIALTALALIAGMIEIALLAAAEQVGPIAILTLFAAAVLFFPRVATAVFVLFDGVQLAFLVLSPSVASTAAGGYFAVGLIGLTSLAWRHAPVRDRIAKWGVPVAFLLLLGALVGFAYMPVPQVLIGIRITFSPLIAFFAAAAFSSTQLRRVVFAAGVVVLASNIAVIYELQAGVAGLQNLGLRYGGSIRTFSGVLRPPGLFVASYVYGAFAAVTAVLMTLYLLRVGARRAGLIWIALNVSAVAGVLLSTSRSALILFVVGLAFAVTTGRAVSALTRFAAFLAAGIAVYAFVQVGSTSTESWEARLQVWGDLLERVSLPFGAGWGSTGAATLSSVSTGPNVTDSYFIALVYQIGLLAIPVIFLGLLMAVWIAIRSNPHPLRWAGSCAIVGLIASFVLIETWEYTSATALALLAVGLADSDDTSSIVSVPNAVGSQSQRSFERLF